MSALREVLSTRFQGVITVGAHEENGEACLLEAAHAAVGDPWSDLPDRWPDLRALNDGLWSSDALRTQYLIPVLEAYWEWSSWPRERQQTVMARVVILTMQRIVAELPGLPLAIANACRTVATLADALAAARAAAAARSVAWATAEVARAAAESAALAAVAAAEAARAAAMAAYSATEADTVLITACQLWIEAAG